MHEGDTRDVASHRLKRTMRGAMAASAVIAAVSLTPSPATADPSTPPPASNDPAAQARQLSQQADALNEQYNAAKTSYDANQAALNKANADLAAAKEAEAAAQAQEDQFRGQVDKLTDASFEGAQFNQLSALLTGSSTQDFLDRATALQDLAQDNDTALDKLSSATKAAQAAQARAQADQQKAQDATNAAAALMQQIQQKYTALQTQISQVQQALGKLSRSQRDALGAQGDMGSFIAPPGIAGAAMEAALGQRGVPYKWGGASPAGFDCSGLVMWSYQQVGGPSLPHSAQGQSSIGQLISNRADLQPGDLVFFGSSSYIHHVGIYVGDGKMVDAPDFGQVVKVEPLDNDYAWGRRLGG